MDRQQVNLLLWMGRNELSAVIFHGTSATRAQTLQTDRLDAVQQPALSLSFSSRYVLGFLEAPPGLGFLRWKDARRRRLCLVFPIVFDLALLGTFKYANFALSSGNWLLQSVHSNLRAPSFDIVLSIGIS